MQLINPSIRKVLELYFVAIIILISHVLMIYLFNYESGFVKLLEISFNWDSHHYLNIFQQGITCYPFDSANAAFFPGYPFIAKYSLGLFGVSGRLSLQVISIFFQLSNLVLIMCFFHSWKLSQSYQILFMTLMVFYPSTFYLYFAYSESVFIFFGLFYFYLVYEKKDRFSIFIAGLSAFLASTVRLFGVLFAFFPLVLRCFQFIFFTDEKHRRQFCCRDLILVCAGILGLGLFLVYCQEACGSWDFYFHRQYFSWSLGRDFIVLFRPSTYNLNWSNIFSWTLDSGNLNKFLAVFYVGFYLAVLILEITFSSIVSCHRGLRLGFYMMSFLLYLLPLSIVSTIPDFRSFSRYSLVPFILLILGLANFFSSNQYFIKKGRLFLILFTPLILFFGYLQMNYFNSYKLFNFVP